MEDKVTLWIYFNNGDNENSRATVTMDQDDYDAFWEYLFDGDGHKGFYAFNNHKMYINCAQITHIVVSK